MLRVIYTNSDVLVALVPTRGREILFIAIPDIVVFSIYLYIIYFRNFEIHHFRQKSTRFIVKRVISALRGGVVDEYVRAEPDPERYRETDHALVEELSALGLLR